jgi:hypothetical protein
MSIFFAHRRGAVCRVAGPWPNTGGLVVAVEGWPYKPTGGMFFTAICTQAGITHNGNFQFLHTINDTIYVYVFGDRIAELTIAGVAFSQLCGSPIAGINETMALYERDRIAVRARPLVVTLGRYHFKSFLTGMTANVSDSELQLTQFNFRFNCFPAQT